ncbi:MAG: SLC13 family permease [Anaerolineales bacterium]
MPTEPMTLEIILTLIILAAAVILFISEKLRPDLIALMVLLALTLTGLVTLEEAISGFSSPAVIVVWAMFVLSAGLARTGVTNMLGARVMQFAGRGEARLIAVLMLAAGLISGYTGMNNTGTTALMLPVVTEIARRTRRAASHLLLPMLYAILIGGMSLLISSPVNLLANEALQESGYPPLGMFAFTPAATVFFVAAILFIALIGRRWLPTRQTPKPLAAAAGVPTQAALQADHLTLYGLEERLAYFNLPEDSLLKGKSLAESRIGTALGLTILGVQREGRELLPPAADMILEGGDRLLVLGRLDRLKALIEHPPYRLVKDPVTITQILSAQVGLAEFTLNAETTSLNGKSLSEIGMRQNYGVNVLAIQQADTTRRTNLQNMKLMPGDTLLIQGPIVRLEDLRGMPGYRRLGKDDARAYQLEDRLLYLSLPEDSYLVGSTLAETRLGAAYGLAVLDVIRKRENWLMPKAEMVLEPGDVLIVEGRPQDIDVVRGLQNLTIETNVDIDLDELEAGPLSFVEVVLSPYSSLADKTIRELHFREKYGLSVLAIWRGSRAYRTDLGDFRLQYGDALLCYGPRDRFAILARDEAFIVLSPGLQPPPRQNRAAVALLILAGVIASVMFNWLPIAIAALIGMALMVLTGCLTMDEAYRAIEWKAVFLIAGMLPLGIAIQQSGTADYIAALMINSLGGMGPVVILGSVFLLTLLGTQFIPNPVMAVLMAPIAITTAANLGVQPYAFLMGVAYAATSSFLTPVAHPANVLVMSPGGYHFGDYLKNGLMIAVIIFVLALILLPLLFPF